MTALSIKSAAMLEGPVLGRSFLGRSFSGRSFSGMLFLVGCLLLPASLTGQTLALKIDVGTRLDDFALKDQNGQSRPLSQLVAAGPLALVTFRSAGWCSVSKDQLAELQQNTETLHSAGLQIAGLSYDRQEVLQSFAARKRIGFPLLADPKAKPSVDWGLSTRLTQTAPCDTASRKLRL